MVRATKSKAPTRKSTSRKRTAQEAVDPDLDDDIWGASEDEVSAESDTEGPEESAEEKRLRIGQLWLHEQVIRNVACDPP